MGNFDGILEAKQNMELQLPLSQTEILTGNNFVGDQEQEPGLKTILRGKIDEGKED